MKLRVFKNQYGFSTLAKNKNTGDKMYISVQFTQGTEPNLEKVDIKINDAFFSMYKNKAGFAFPKLVIMDYTIAEEQPSNDLPQHTQNNTPPFTDNDVPAFMGDDDSLPF